MATNYARIQQTVQRLLKNASGQSPVALVVQIHTPGTYDATTGAVTGDSDASFNVWGAHVPWETKYVDGKKFEWNQTFKDGTAIIETDIRCFISALQTNGVALPFIKQGDKVQFNGELYTIIQVNPIMPAGIPVLFDVQLRQ